MQLIEGYQLSFLTHEDSDLPVAYFPAWLSKTEADELLSLSMTADWQQNTGNMFGKPIAMPRLETNYGTGTYRYNGIDLAARPWTEAPYLLMLRRRLEAFTGHQFGIAIGNRYRSGADHIGYHSDKGKSMGARPAIASISLGATRKFDVKQWPDGLVRSYDLAHGDLVVMMPGCQETCRHRIRKAKTDGERINWTFRPFVNG